MFLFYADESGDPGLGPGASDTYVVSGIAIRARDWKDSFSAIVAARRQWGRTYGIPQRLELHAYYLAHNRGRFSRAASSMARSQCLSLYADALRCLAGLRVRLISVCIHKDALLRHGGATWVDKDGATHRTDVFTMAWQFALQRFHNSVMAWSERCPEQRHGMVVTDMTRDVHLRALMRRLRAHNPVPSHYSPDGWRNLPLDTLIDDPMPRDSRISYFVQMADLAAFALAKQVRPGGSLARFGFETYYGMLEPIMHKAACKPDPQGVFHWPR